MARFDGLVRRPDGELVEDVDLVPAHPLTCRRGWLGEDVKGQPIPCPVCKAATLERVRQLRARLDPTREDPS